MDFDFDQSIGHRLNRCVILLRLLLSERFSDAGYDITPEEWAVLNRLWQTEGRSQNEIAQSTVKDKTTVTRLLNRMETKGLVLRRISETDSRVNLIFLTSYGKKLKDELIPIAVELLSAAINNISQRDLKVTLAVLEKIEDNFLQM